MRAVLVDTSIWVDHFRHGNEGLVSLLALDLVVMHPLVLGEIACGTPPARSQTLADLGRLQPARQANLQEVMAFIELHQLFGLGCGLIDLTLLASTLMSPDTVLWTQDKRLATLAERFGVMHLAPLH